MPPRDFSEDGAFGAGTPGAGSPTGGTSVSDPGSPSAGGAAAYTEGMINHTPGSYSSGPDGLSYKPLSASQMQGASDYTQGQINHTAGNYTSGPGGLGYSPLTAQQQAGSSAYTQGMIDHTPGTYKSGPGGFSFSPAAGPGTGFSFAAGGAIPDEDINGSPDQDAIQRALTSVDAVLAFGRKLHGLGGNEEDDGAIKMAGRMPSVPGNPSNSGVPPAQPMPGPLPPTSNPFGKRADAGYTNGRMPMIPGTQSESGVPPIQPMPGPLPPTSNPFGKRADAGGDDQSGAIDTSDEEAA